MSGEREEPPVEMDEPTDKPTLYANNVELTSGPFDLVMDFGFKPPEAVQRRQMDLNVPVARVAMSLAHAKSMLPLLARVIAEYEQKVGPITAPGYDDNAKE